jgi:hypothetical protein
VSSGKVIGSWVHPATGRYMIYGERQAGTRDSRRRPRCVTGSGDTVVAFTGRTAQRNAALNFLLFWTITACLYHREGSQ